MHIPGSFPDFLSSRAHAPAPACARVCACVYAYARACMRVCLSILSCFILVTLPHFGTKLPHFGRGTPGSKRIPGQHFAVRYVYPLLINQVIHHVVHR